jgi:serine/threonine protein kinase
MGACLSTPDSGGPSSPPASNATAVGAGAQAAAAAAAAAAHTDLAEIASEDLAIQEKLREDANYIYYRASWFGSAVTFRVLKRETTRRELADELHVVASTRHPSLMLCMGYAFSVNDKRFGLVTPHMSRGTLFDVLHRPAKEVPLPWRHRMSALLDTARAMLFVHRAGGVHGALSSQSILMDDEYRAKLTDFGLGKLLADTQSAVGGSLPLWTAPEVVMGARASQAADVYSFGIIVWEMLTRQIPFGSDVQTPIRLLRMVTNSGLRPTIPDGCPPPLISLLERCWSAEPAVRPDFSVIVDDLTAFSKVAFDVAQIVVADAVEAAAAAALESQPRVAGLDLRAARQAPWHIAWSELKLGALLGAGSFGQVFQGVFRGKTVAIKTLTPALAQSAAAMGDFVKELTLMSAMRHPHCVLFLGACLEAPNICIVMEFCAKGSLHSVLHDKSMHLDYNRILDVTEHTAQAMAYLHGNRPAILHRDLKSLNILVDQDWCVKVSDFGLTSAKTESKRAANTNLGTPLWQAPEAHEGANLDEAADVYSFAIIMWELWTRQNPFAGLSPVQAAMAVMTKDARPNIPDFVPQAWTALIGACWQRDKTRRPRFPEIVATVQQIRKAGLPRTTLSRANAAHYRKNALVHAVRSADPVTVFKSWGSGESKAGDWIIVGKGDDVYTCDHAIFMKTYRPEGKLPNMFRKVWRIGGPKLRKCCRLLGIA